MTQKKWQITFKDIKDHMFSIPMAINNSSKFYVSPIILHFTCVLSTSDNNSKMPENI